MGDFAGVVKGYKGSTAESYAEKYGRKFEAIEDTSVISTTTSTTTAKPTTTSATSTSTTTANNVADSKIIKELEEKISALESENAALKDEVEQLKNALTANTFGDIDGNDIIDGRDATMLLTYYAKTSTGYSGTLAEFVVASQDAVATTSNDT